MIEVAVAIGTGFEAVGYVQPKEKPTPIPIATPTPKENGELQLHSF